jgi:AmiR/NasT family two-component response regulator
MSADNATRHILVVDDDRLVLASLARGLRQGGYRVSEAANGEDAFNVAERTSPDLALLDVRMPGMNGIELGRMLREHAGVPFLYLSAYGQADIVAQAAQNGALGYLVKPLDIAQILPSVETALLRAAEIRALRDKEGQLANALGGSRDVSVAVGLLMERHHVDREEAFEALRARARSARRTLVDVAHEILSSSEKLNTYKKLGTKLKDKK